MLPIVGQPQIDQGFHERVPAPLFGPAPEAHMDRIPFAAALVHIAAWTADAQHMQHPIEEAPIIVRRPAAAPPLGGKKRLNDCPLRIRQITTHPAIRSRINVAALRKRR